jgi:hypothetical protein
MFDVQIYRFVLAFGCRGGGEVLNVDNAEWIEGASGATDLLVLNWAPFGFLGKAPE